MLRAAQAVFCSLVALGIQATTPDVPKPGEPFPLKGRTPEQACFFFQGTPVDTPEGFQCLDLTVVDLKDKPLIFTHTMSPFTHNYGLVIPPKSRIRAKVDTSTVRIFFSMLREPGSTTAERDRPALQGTNWADYWNHSDVPVRVLCMVTPRGSDMNQNYTLTLQRRD